MKKLIDLPVETIELIETVSSINCKSVKQTIQDLLIIHFSKYADNPDVIKIIKQKEKNRKLLNSLSLKFDL